MTNANKKKHMYCVNCGAKLQDNANFCGACGCPVELDLLSADGKKVDVKINKEFKAEAKNDEKVIGEKSGPFNLRISEKRYTIRKNYIVRDEDGNVLYSAKSEGLPKMPEIVVYKNDKPVGRIEKELFAKPFWGARSTHYIGRARNTLLSCERKCSNVSLRFQSTAGDLSLELRLLNSTIKMKY